VVWHDFQAANCIRSGQWSEALFHLDQLVEAQPKTSDWHLRRARALIGLGQAAQATEEFSKALELKTIDGGWWQKIGQACAEQGKWDQAATAFQRFAELEVSDDIAWSWQALAVAARGDVSGHQKICAAMLDKFGKTQDAEIANNVAWFCMRTPDCMTDFSQPLHLVEKSVELRPNQYFSLNTSGIALYRVGRFQDSILRLNEAIKAHGQGGTPYDWLFLAMAHHRLGHADESKKWMTKAQQWLDQGKQEKAKDKPAAVDALPWDQRLELSLIRAEAEALLNGDTKKQRLP
jgi:Flp pilus assembly protein TadD